MYTWCTIGTNTCAHKIKITVKKQTKWFQVWRLKDNVNFIPFPLIRLQRGKKQQIENGSGAEDNGDSSHCSNASTHSNQEAGPSNKRTKTSDDSGLELDNNNAAVAIDPVMDGASEIELVFRPHPTLMEKDDSAQTRYIKTSGNATVDHLSKYLAVRLALEELRSKGESNQMNLDTASEKQYTIYIATASGQFTVLNGSFSLELVSEKYWKVNKPMELYYAPTKEHKWAFKSQF